jgi:hypothetical protein
VTIGHDSTFSQNDPPVSVLGSELEVVRHDDHGPTLGT